MNGLGMVRLPTLSDIDPVIAVARASRDEARPFLMERRLVAAGKSPIAVGALFILAMVFGLIGSTNSSEEATAVLERLASKVESPQRISPETRNVLAKLLAERDYDCDRLKCSARLHERNRVARARVENAIDSGSIEVSAMK
jgi:hypothetical protein